jgi:hypothetical protein
VVVVAELRELSLRVASAPLGPTMPPTTDAFKATEDTKAMQIDAGFLAEIVPIRATLDPK